MNQFIARIALAVIVMAFSAGCGSRFSGAEPTPTIPSVPTFTPTPETVDSTTEQPPEAVPTETPTVSTAAEATTPADDAAAQENVTAEPAQEGAILLPTPTVDAEAAEPSAPTAQPSLEPLLVISGELVNVRGGPGTNYAQIGTATSSEEFVLTGRNEVGDWWQVCCFAEQPGWIYGPLAEVKNAESVAVAADIPEPAVVEAEPESEPAVAVAVEEPAPEAPQEAPRETGGEALTPGVALAHSGTEGNFDPRAQYQIVNYRVLGYDENNGGIFNNGGQHMIFVNVVDENGNGVEAVVKDAVNNKIAIVTGAKGPGRAEFEMFGEKFKLYVASDSSGDVTSQISNQMDTVWPHIPDIIGKLGPLEEELSICPTPDVRCEPPFYRAHWSYEVTFQKVK